MKLRDIAQKLNSSLDARMLVKAVTGLSDTDLIGLDVIPLTTEQSAILDDFIAQRLNHRPVAKIIGHKEFYGRNFHVNDDVLDPRPETELIIDAVIRHCEQNEAIQGQRVQPLDCHVAISPRNDGFKILDLGTGSGCILLTLLAELRNATGIGADISPQALSIAKRNAQNLNLCDRAEFIESSWLESITGSFDIIVTNPP